MRLRYPTALAARLMPRDDDWWGWFSARLVERTANDNAAQPSQQEGR